MAIKGTNNGYSIIHAASDADLSSYNYFQVYAGASATPTINGTSVTMGAGSKIDISIKSISSTANVYVIGEPKNVIDGPATLSNYPEPS
jgi:hypothetical protein